MYRLPLPDSPPAHRPAHRPALRAMLVMLLGSVFGMAVLPAAVAGTVYRWVDDKGVVNYTTTPPASGRKAAQVDVAPAVAGQGVAMEYDEARYWRARADREAARDLALERQAQETEALRQTRLRQEIAAAEQTARQKSAAQLAAEQCRAARYVDCDTRAGVDAYERVQSGSLYVYPPVVVVTRRPPVTPSAPYFSVTPQFTPGFSKPLIYPSR